MYTLGVTSLFPTKSFCVASSSNLHKMYTVLKLLSFHYIEISITISSTMTIFSSEEKPMNHYKQALFNSLLIFFFI